MKKTWSEKIDLKSVELVKQLHLHREKLDWNEAVDDDDSTFMVDISEYVIKIKKHISKVHPEDSIYYTIGIYIDDFGSTLIEQINAKCFAGEVPDSWKLFDDIFTAARRKAMDVDAAYDAILASLKD